MKKKLLSILTVAAAFPAMTIQANVSDLGISEKDSLSSKKVEGSERKPQTPQSLAKYK